MWVSTSAIIKDWLIEFFFMHIKHLTLLSDFPISIHLIFVLSVLAGKTFMLFNEFNFDYFAEVSRKKCRQLHRELGDKLIAGSKNREVLFTEMLIFATAN